MPDLIAQGSEPHHRWRRKLMAGQSHVLGRTAAGWEVPWDECISRQHVEMRWEGGRLAVARLPEARNPVFFRGRACDRCSIRPGEHFVVGSTSFLVVDERIDVTHDAPRPDGEQVFPSRVLSRARFRDADGRIDMLSRLPEIITGSSSDAELFVRLVSLLLNGIPRADFVAVVRHEMIGPSDWKIEVLHWDARGTGLARCSPSARLIHDAVEKKQSVLHTWQAASPGDGSRFTQSEGIDWAFCTPACEESSPGWAIYVAGQARSGSRFDPRRPEDLQDDLKFTELASATVTRLRALRRLERDRASLSQFISPVVLDRLSDRDPEDVLAPREAEVSVLFCDLRGFSRKSEQSSHDLMGLLNRVSQALGVMTRQILDQGGVVGDFHGDAAMGFWGWPLAQEDAVVRACRAALAIRAEFAATSRPGDHPLADFRVGIGVATGRAVAGKIGTLDQVKITVFGPVVNLAARLEELTKVLRAPILVDETTARLIKQKTGSDVVRVRRVARVRPPGLEQALEVSELLPPAAEYAELSDENIAAYEAALDALLACDWPRAFSLLHHVPAEDRVKDFLTVFIAQHNRTPPPDWDGVIDIQARY